MTCSHPNHHPETDEDLHGNKQHFYVCDDCGVEFGDPVADEAEYLANVRDE